MQQQITRRCLRTDKFSAFRRYLSHFRVVEHVVPGSYIRTYPGAVEPDAENDLRLAVKQYVPLKDIDGEASKDAVTIIGGHANGFPKELYEPLWDDLYEELDSHGCNIHSIWIADIVNQGQSGKLNQSILGNDPNWWDHARDVLYLINRKQSCMSRLIVGIGHSMGASILTALALLHPSLFQSLVLVEPVIQTENPSRQFAPASTHRRDRWPSRQQAINTFAQSKFYQSWDQRVLERWTQHGVSEDLTGKERQYLQDSHSGDPAVSREAALHDAVDEARASDKSTADIPVTLTTTKAQEVFHYLRPLYKGQSTSESLKNQLYPDINELDLEQGYEFYRPEPAEIFRRLPELRPSALYLFGSRSPLADPLLIKKKIETTGTGVGGSGGVRKGYVAGEMDVKVISGAIFSPSSHLPPRQLRFEFSAYLLRFLHPITPQSIIKTNQNRC